MHLTSCLGCRRLTQVPTTNNVSHFPNPIFGESEGELKKYKAKSSYAKYMRESIKELFRKKSEDKLKFQKQKEMDREYVQRIMQDRDMYADNQTHHYEISWLCSLTYCR